MEREPNAEQQCVINDFKNNIILYASAGTGKTYTVANKVNAAISGGLAAPEEILCLTFTIKACGEMQEDISHYTPHAKGVNIKTIHGFCLNIIDGEAKRSGADYISPTVFDDIDEEEYLQKTIPAKLTARGLEDFLNKNGISADLSGQDIVFLRGRGFFWKLNCNGNDLYLNSRTEILYGEQAEKLNKITLPSDIICPECGQRQREKENFCNFCGCDFRKHIAPRPFGVKRFRNLISEIKRRREIYCRYSGDGARDYRDTFERFRSECGQKYDELFSFRKDGATVFDEEFALLFSAHAGRLIAEYDGELRRSNRLDFDDLIILAARTLKSEEAAARWRKRFKFIVVDEMQDTSDLEYSVLKPLFYGNRVMLCGDFFQTIYEWRGSRPQDVLEDFKRSFNAKPYMFRRNYRATRTLANASFGYLKNSFPELIGEYCPDDLEISGGDEGEPIRYVKCKNQLAEAKFIYRYILKHRPAKPSSTCIITRSNGYISRLKRLLASYGETLAESERLDFFTVEEDYRFFKKPIIKDFLAFFGVLLNDDELSMERVAERYIRGAGPVTLAEIRQNSAGVSLASFLSKDSYERDDCYFTLIEEFEKSNIVVYDIETTGVDVSADEIIQIAGVKIDAEGHICGSFNQMVVPEREISEGALATHGYDKEYIKSHGGVSAKEALKAFSAFASGAAIVGHNSAKFDSTVIKRQLAECGLPELDIAGEYDTLALSKKFFPEFKNHKLETLCEMLGVVNERAHDAFADVAATAGVLAFIVNEKLKPACGERADLIKRYKNKFKAFYQSYGHMKTLLKRGDIAGLIDYITDEFNIFGVNGREEDKTAASDLTALISGDIHKFPTAEACLHNLICEAELSGSRVDFLVDKLNKIPIITVHQSKGCEFETVVLCGADDNNFPEFAAVQSGNEDEEKRVFYVAVSRAKSKLVITNAKYALSRWGNGYARAESRYISKIPAEFIEVYDYTE